MVWQNVLWCDACTVTPQDKDVTPQDKDVTPQDKVSLKSTLNS